MVVKKSARFNKSYRYVSRDPAATFEPPIFTVFATFNRSFTPLNLKSNPPILLPVYLYTNGTFDPAILSLIGHPKLADVYLSSFEFDAN